jgi:amino acid permease
MLIVKASEKTGKTRYEDIALAIYGPRVAMLTSFFNLACLIGFTFSYIVYVKKAVPGIIESYIDLENTDIPHWMLNNNDGNLFWGLIFAFAVLFPLSLPRNASALRYTSLVGVLCSMYLSLTVTIVFLFDRDIVPDISYNLS